MATACNDACYVDCDADCYYQCGASCEGKCDIGCEGCTGGCEGCTGCGDSCSTGCGDGCTSCTGDCDGCTGCGDTCSTGCGDACSGCSGTCEGTCEGCSGTCESACTNCTGDCVGYCDNGCSATNMAEVYAALGKDIVLDAIIKASDVNEIESCIIRELKRRGINYTSVVATLGNPISAEMQTSIQNNCVAGGYATNEPTTTVPSASQMQRYISYIKELYSKIVVP